MAELERAVLDVPGCVYAAEPRPEDARAPALHRPALDVTLAPRRAVHAAEARAAAGDIDGAARLVARAVRTAVMLARSDDPVAWVALGALEDWSRLLDGWAGRVSEAALGVVRLDLKAARRGSWSRSWPRRAADSVVRRRPRTRRAHTSARGVWPGQSSWPETTPLTSSAARAAGDDASCWPS
ncbi:MAG: hypothetical protein U1F43_09495 [Myxococcota bacterium]